MISIALFFIAILGTIWVEKRRITKGNTSSRLVHYAIYGLSLAIWAYVQLVPYPAHLTSWIFNQFQYLNPVG